MAPSPPPSPTTTSARCRSTSVDLPIACVEGWSAQGTWSGVRVADLLRAVDAPADRDVAVTSLQQQGPFRRTTLAGQLRRGRAHPAGSRPLRRATRPRPRLPVPAHRAQPTRRTPDEVGHPAGGGGVRTRLLIGVCGVLLALYGAFLVLSRQDPGQWLEVGCLVRRRRGGPRLRALRTRDRRLPAGLAAAAGSLARTRRHRADRVGLAHHRVGARADQCRRPRRQRHAARSALRRDVVGDQCHRGPARGGSSGSSRSRQSRARG